jgi:uncharacterized protein (DUF1684 family)
MIVYSNRRTAASIVLLVFCILCASVTWQGCDRPSIIAFSPSAADSAAILADIDAYRKAANEYFATDPTSPFMRDTSIVFTGLRWFPPDAGFVVKSRLYRFDTPETVTVLGTKGEPRKHLKHGFFIVRLKGEILHLNVYKYLPEDAQRKGIGSNHLSLWFTDSTTAHETYGVGRYLDIEAEMPDPEHIYTLDFNKSYNPYCAYSPLYSCAIPRKEDRIPIPIRAGEMSYHH